MLNKSVTSGTVSQDCFVAQRGDPSLGSNPSPLGWRLSSNQVIDLRCKLDISPGAICLEKSLRPSLPGEEPQTQPAQNSTLAHWGKAVRDLGDAEFRLTQCRVLGKLLQSGTFFMHANLASSYAGISRTQLSVGGWREP